MLKKTKKTKKTYKKGYKPGVVTKNIIDKRVLRGIKGALAKLVAKVERLKSK